MKHPPLDANAFLRERFEALIQEFDHVGGAAPSGQVLNNLDAFLFVNGRKFLTEFSKPKRGNVSTVPKNPLTRENVRIVKKTKNVGKRTKTVTTANNRIHLVRTYRHCDDH